MKYIILDLDDTLIKSISYLTDYVLSSRPTSICLLTAVKGAVLEKDSL